MCSGPPLFCGEEVGGGGRRGVGKGRGGPLFALALGETDGKRVEFPRVRADFSEAVRPCLGPGPAGLAGEGGGAVLLPAGGAVTAESGPRFVPVRERATVVWTVAAGRALSGPCWRAVCRSGTGLEGKQNRLRARVLSCNRERGVWPDEGGPPASAHVSLQRGEGAYGRMRGGPLAGARVSLQWGVGRMAGRGGPFCGRTCSPATGRGGCAAGQGGSRL